MVDFRQDEKSTFDIVIIVVRSDSVVKRVVTKLNRSESKESFPSCGKPRKTSHRHDRIITECRFRTGSRVLLKYHGNEV